MIDLQSIVIPKIMNEWEYIANALYYDLPIIKVIKEGRNGHPKLCCYEFFKDWLMTKHGTRAGPKVWSTLVDAMKQIDEISNDTIEEIVKRVIEGTDNACLLSVTVMHK